VLHIVLIGVKYIDCRG